MKRPKLAELAWVFFRIGNTTFGGGMPTMAALQREFVERRKWLSLEDYGLSFSLSRITPGTNVIAFCAATGAQILGVPGALVGALGETAPSAILAVMLTQGYETWRTNPWVTAAIAGTIAAVAGMMWSSIALMVKPYFTCLRSTFRALVITLGAFWALFRFGLGPVQIIGLAVIVGLLWKDSEGPNAAREEAGA